MYFDVYNISAAIIGSLLREYVDFQAPSPKNPSEEEKIAAAGTKTTWKHRVLRSLLFTSVVVIFYADDPEGSIKDHLILAAAFPSLFAQIVDAYTPPEGNLGGRSFLISIRRFFT